MNLLLPRTSKAVSNLSNPAVEQWFQEHRKRQTVSNDDLVAAVGMLAGDILEIHQRGLVAALTKGPSLTVCNGWLRLSDEAAVSPRANPEALQVFRNRATAAVDVVSTIRIPEPETAATDDSSESKSILVQELPPLSSDRASPDEPCYLTGYQNWETAVGHHDPLTDVFSLGMIFASLATGLDFHSRDDLEKFVRNRSNLFALKPDLHPVLAKLIHRMTELDRACRPPDLAGLVESLRRYRDQSVDVDYDLARIPGFRESPVHDRRQRVFAVLQKRLFELSRRNRLLHFRGSAASLNLTACSVPVSFAVDQIRPEDLITWNGEFARQICAGKAITLSTKIRPEETPYVPGTLDRIRSESRKDLAEFGFDPLKLVLCFLRWSNLKETPSTEFHTPFALLPVKLVKKKGVRDAWQLEPQSTEAEINPVLRHYLKQLYNVVLPEAVDLETTSLATLFEFLSTRLQASEPGVTLSKIDRPRIALLQAQAQQRLEQYRRRAASQAEASESSTAESEKTPSPTTDSEAASPSTSGPERPEAPVSTSQSPSDTSSTFDEQSPNPSNTTGFAVLESAGASNPYRWEFDLCSVTLGNFRYRKMSLVRDYEALLGREHPHPGFDDVFSLSPREIASPAPLDRSIGDRFPIVACDPTQTAAIDFAGTGSSYIIQGPPGTGKSQSITNLIADFVSRGKRVLFVCEKRAAIDVVFHRLKKCGLESLCCLVHDSQADKKAFIQDLKATYEEFLIPNVEKLTAQELRDATIKAYQKECQPLEDYERAMNSVFAAAGVTARQLMLRILELPARPELSPQDQERLPPYLDWEVNRQKLAALAQTLEEVCEDARFASHPLSSLNPELSRRNRPAEAIQIAVDAIRTAASRLQSALNATFPDAANLTWDVVHSLVETADQLRDWTTNRRLSLLLAQSKASQEWEAALENRESLLATAQSKRAAANAWKVMLSPDDTAAALELAESFENRTFAFLTPSWWRLRGVLNRSYDFRAQTVRRSWKQALRELQELHAADAVLKSGEEDLRRRWNILGEVEAFRVRLEQTRQSIRNSPIQERLAGWLAESGAEDRWLKIADLKTLSEPMQTQVAVLLQLEVPVTLAGLLKTVEQIHANQNLLADFLPCLKQLAELPAAFRVSLVRLRCPLPVLESASAGATLEGILRENRSLGKFSAKNRERQVRKIEESYERLFQVNAAAIRDLVRQRFQNNVQLSNASAASVSASQRELRTRYAAGRKTLEHEFGKSMRYKSIRDLAVGDSGLVVQDLKPIWLMSPLSVSDTLPLDAVQVDAVLFDEASQITLEEAIPAVFRGAQMIVVGDEMQLPPTSFFASRSSDDEETSEGSNNQSAGPVYDLDADSFLTHTARRLPSVMLGWHYRSRSESLISFSNAAFYQGRLLTVPEEERLQHQGQPQEHELGDDDVRLLNSLLGRPVSFHRLENAVYADRRNRSEAECIARLVRGVLRRNAESSERLSIGVIAFSEAQQDEIERALSRLAEDDPEFADRLEAEYEREDDGQFVGLLVKNLENIQGDERDVVILSVCYGPDPEKKMRMNFGPINQSGGEKRLNVAFSRAKRHMAIVSSIRAPQITNEFNVGANCLRNYLRYSEALSSGDLETAQRVLAELSPAARNRTRKPGDDLVADQLAEALREEGWLVDRDVGQSHFRCHLAVAAEGDASYRLGILLPDSPSQANVELMERDVLRPRLLRNFGWKIVTVLTRDWCLNREEVLKTLRKDLGSPS